jgi:hypothetical protein
LLQNLCLKPFNLGKTYELMSALKDLPFWILAALSLISIASRLWLILH